MKTLLAPSRLRALALWAGAGLLALSLGLAHAAESAPRVLFVGNSFLFASGSPVRYYRAASITDLNGEGIGGVPALFKAFATQAGIDVAVSAETSSGKNLDFHLKEKSAVLAQPWDQIVMHGYSLLDREHPGQSEVLIKSARALVDLFCAKNPKVDIRVMATWARADHVYPAKGVWHGKGLEGMTRDIRTAYDAVAADSPRIRGVIPVGEAFLRAMNSGVADPNPYDGIAAGQLNLWTYDSYHASTAGYYLEAAVIFGSLTKLDPRSLGQDEPCAFELGLSKEQAAALQRIAYEELMAAKGAAELKPFKPIAASAWKRL